MLIEISFGNERTEVDLADGVVHVGGAATDGIRVEGMPRSLLTLNLLGERLMVTASKAVAIGGVRFPAHIPRLVVPGEKMQLPSGVCLKQLPPRDQPHRAYKGTACVLKEMVGDGFCAANSRAASFTCLTGLDAGHSHPVAMSETLIGRGEHCGVRIRDRAVSRRHARVLRRRSGDFLEALPGTNGLFLNGEPVEKVTGLKTGDVIELGQSLLRYDGPEKALVAEEDTEPTVLVSEEQAAKLPPEPPAELEAAPPVKLKAEAVGRPKPPAPSELVLLAAGAALVLIGLGVTLSASV